MRYEEAAEAAAGERDLPEDEMSDKFDLDHRPRDGGEDACMPQEKRISDAACVLLRLLLLLPLLSLPFFRWCSFCRKMWQKTGVRYKEKGKRFSFLGRRWDARISSLGLDGENGHQ